MVRTKIQISLNDFPDEIKNFLNTTEIYDSSCSTEAKVYYIDKDQGYYLKVSETKSLRREAEMTEYFGKIGLGAKAIKYISGEKDYLLTERVRGEDLTFTEYINDPVRLAEASGKLLRKLHETDYSQCPIQDRLSESLKMAKDGKEKGLFSCEFHIPEKYRPNSADEAWRFVTENKHILNADTLIHGDYCLPNVIFNSWKFSGFIDVGNGGVSDRHFDLFWGAWTLEFNLKTDKYAEIFFNAYGKDRINMTALKTVAYIECFC